MTELEAITIFAAVLFCGFMAMVALHLRLIFRISWNIWRRDCEAELLKQRLDDWVSGTGRTD